KDSIQIFGVKGWDFFKNSSEKGYIRGMGTCSVIGEGHRPSNRVFRYHKSGVLIYFIFKGLLPFC
ncbi:MAG: hypothetical protein KKD67_10120, partial [Proteobacteria bacterium]|nr:hypothetical protein [Pseudomonadota bacterium]